MALGNNLRKARISQNLTLDQLSVMSGVDIGTISALEMRDSSRSKYFGALARALGVTLEQLESGNLPAQQVVDIYVSKDETSHLAIPSYIVPVFEAVASMGLGKPQPDADTVVDNIRLTKTWVDSHLPSVSSPNNLAVLSAYGDSMAPTFTDGDLLLVDRGVDSIKIDAVYVLALNGELYVKRIQRRITDGAFIIKSDNPLYDPVTVQNGERDGLSVLGRVVWAWNGRKL